MLECLRNLNAYENLLERREVLLQRLSSTTPQPTALLYTDLHKHNKRILGKVHVLMEETVQYASIISTRAFQGNRFFARRHECLAIRRWTLGWIMREVKQDRGMKRRVDPCD